MATLRDLIPGFDPTLGALIPGSAPRAPAMTLRGPATAEIEDRAEASDMGQLRRGYTSGRLGGEINALAAEESGLRASGRVAEADAVRQRIAPIQQRAAVFAPAEQDVTKLNWEPGRIVDYALGSAGQGAASMQDPIALVAGANAAGGLASRLPGPGKLIGAGLRGAGLLGAYALNAEQAKGEFYNDALQDPEIMRTKSAQEINTTGNVVGGVSGLIDTALPAAVGGRIVGRQGLRAMSGLGLPAKVGVDLLGEGVQEVVQEGGKKLGLGAMNPNRDTSGDAADYLNSFAGGVAGAGPISLGSHVVAKGFERLGVKDDTSSNDVSGKTASATPGAAPEDKTLVGSMARSAKQRVPSAEAEAWRMTLTGEVQGEEDVRPYGEVVGAQHAALTKELTSRAAKGDAVAQQHLDALAAQDMNDPVAQFDEAPRAAAAKYILGDNPDNDARLIKAYENRQLNSQRRLNTQTFPGTTVGDERVAYADMGSGKGSKTGGVEVAPTPEVQKRYTEERRAIKQRALLTADVMTSAVRADAPPQFKKIADELGREIAEMAGSGYVKPTAADQARVQRIGRQMNYLYRGERAQGVLKQIMQTAGIKGTPLGEVLETTVAFGASAAPQQAVARDTAAQQLVDAIPPRAQLSMRRAGLDLTTPEGREAMLDHVEAFFDEESDRSVIEFNKTFGGREVVEAMRQVVGQRLQPRVQALTEADLEADDAADDKTPAVSDEVDAEAKEAGADWEKKGAEKTLEKAPGTKEYFFKGKTHSVLGTDPAVHPFTPDAKTKNLPTLSRLDDENEDGRNSLERAEEQAYRSLGIEADNTALPTTRVRTVSAKEVMDGHSVGKDRRIELMRDYLARAEDGKVALSRDDATVQQLQTLESRIARMEKDTPKEVSSVQAAVGRMARLPREQGVDGEVVQPGQTLQQAGRAIRARLDKRENPAYVALQDLKGQREEAMASLAAKVGVEHKEGMTVEDVANAYFSDRYLVAAEQMGEKDLLRMAPAEAKQMIRRGNDDIDFSAQAGTGRMAMLADMNLIRFKSPLAVAKNGEAAVRASDLVEWVRKNRTQFDEDDKPSSGTAKAYEFRNALMEGIAAMVADGHMEGLPWMLDAQGKKESFGASTSKLKKGTKDSYEGNFPPSLKLDTTTQAKLDYGRKMRAEQAAVKQGPLIEDSGNKDPDAVAAEQDKELVSTGDAQEPDRITGAWDETTQRNAIQNAALPKIDTLTPTNAMRKAERLADSIWGEFPTGRAGAYARLQRLVDALERPVYREEGDNGPVGGVHYAAPLAHLLTPQRVARLVATAKDPAAAQQKLAAMRGEVAKALLHRSTPSGDRLVLARLLAGEKLKINQVKEFLEGLGAKPMQAKAEPKVEAPAKAPAKTRVLNTQSTSLHQELKRPGFAATHDSPIRHEGKFDWRKHKLKGEGAAAFGAGTYLSTGDGVHRYYKKSFTAMVNGDGIPTDPKYLALQNQLALIRWDPVSPEKTAKMDAIKAQMKALEDQYKTGKNGFGNDKSPTYQVSVDIPPERLLNWDAPLSEQPPTIKLRAIKAAKDNGVAAEPSIVDGDSGPEAVDTGRLGMTGEQLYKALAGKLGSQDKASDYLQSLGILGHTYAAANGKDSTAPNYVIYDDSKITTNFVAFNKQTSPAGVQSAENAAPLESYVEAARAYVKKVLGPKVKVAFEKEFDAAGEWINAENLIKLALSNGKGMLTVAHHEAMHAFWDGLVANNPKAAAALRNTLSSQKIYERLKAELRNEPAALEQIANDPNERVAYAFQFWAAGALDVDKPAATLFAKFRRFLRTVFGMVRESETALDIMTAFHEGKLADESAAGRVIKGIMARQTWNEDVRRKFDKQLGFLHSVVAPSNDVLRNEKLSATAQALGLAMYTNPGEFAAGKFKEGYLNARARVTRQYTNYLYEGLKGLSDRDMLAAIEVLQNPDMKASDVPYVPVRKAVMAMRALTKRYFEYAKEAGLELQYLGDNHFPRVWDMNKLIEEGGKEKFIAMLLQPKYAETMKVAMASAKGLTMEQVAANMHQHLVEKNGVDEKLGAEVLGDVVLSPFFASQKERSFKWLDAEDVKPFLEKDLVGAMTRYLHQGVRAAEFTRRFGVDGADLKELIAMKGDPAFDEDGKPYVREKHGTIAAEIEASIKEQGIKGKEAELMLARHMDDIKKSVGAHEGSIGNDMTAAMRKLSGFALAYQNLRLLPMSLFAAFGDVAAVGAAGAGAKGAFEAFQQGLKDVYQRWKDAASDMPAERVKSTWDKIAEAVGAVDSHMFLEQMGKAHTSEFMTDFARKSNRALFMANGLTAWDRSMRVSATKFGVLFLQHHAGLPDKTHSARWLAELGLKAEDIPLDAEGNLIWNRQELAAHKGIDVKEATEQMEKIHYALVRYVERSVLSPNAAARPSWASDPHYSVLFHLKQFTYSMHHTVIKRALHEASEGNMNPVGALAAAVPMAIASDIVKGLVVGGGSLPAYMQGWDAGDWVAHGASRAGLAGVGQFGIDALSNPVGLFGPTVDQAVKIITNPTDIVHNMHDAVPGFRMIKGLPDFGLGRAD